MGNSLLAVRDINHKYIVVREETSVPYRGTSIPDEMAYRGIFQVQEAAV